MKRLTTEKATESDAAIILREFKDDMKADLKDLRDELRSTRMGALFSKEILVTALAAAGTVATYAFGATFPVLGAITAGGLPASVGGILGAGNKYAAERRSIMQKHPMAYLYAMH